MAASVDQTSGATGRPVVLVSGDYQYSPRVTRGWDAAADGERFLLVKRPPERAARRVMLVTNWVQQLRDEGRVVYNHNVERLVSEAWRLNSNQLLVKMQYAMRF